MADDQGTSASDKRDIDGRFAAEVAANLPHQERVDTVQGLLHVDEIEARLLISHGRRLTRIDKIASPD